VISEPNSEPSNTLQQHEEVVDPSLGAGEIATARSLCLFRSLRLGRNQAGTRAPRANRQHCAVGESCELAFAVLALASPYRESKAVEMLEEAAGLSVPQRCNKICTRVELRTAIESVT
jgi:hypothetical protein